MIRKADALKGYDGPNPFRESQGRSFIDPKISGEFYPTHAFRSCFNEQNEILIGTRGSGKTAILRMLSYSQSRRIADPEISKIVQEKSYIGIYIPLHLEFVTSVGRANADMRTEYFCYSLNSSAAIALINELESLLEDCIPDSRMRLYKGAEIAGDLSQIWLGGSNPMPESLQALSWSLTLDYARNAAWEDGAKKTPPPLAGPALVPIQQTLNRIADQLQLNKQTTQWIACIDEAEFLPEAYIKCINTFMRSAKRPLVLKMATLPFGHRTRATLSPDVWVEANGNDFDYRSIDYKADDYDYRALTNHLMSYRLKRCDIECLSLEEFLGVVGSDDGLDYFRAELGEITESELISQIRGELSETRRRRLDKLLQAEARTAIKSQFLKKYSPVFYVRRMRKQDSQGNRTVGWFAGARVIRRVSEGNPRRFIQLMNDLVDRARSTELTPKNQNRAVAEFCERSHKATENLPKCGPLIKALLDAVGKELSFRVHERDLMDAGCDFKINGSSISGYREAIETAIAYSHIVEHRPAGTALSDQTLLRLSYLTCVCFWIPMRKGDQPPVINPANTKGLSPEPPILASQQQLKLEINELS